MLRGLEHLEIFALSFPDSVSMAEEGEHFERDFMNSSWMPHLSNLTSFTFDATSCAFTYLKFPPQGIPPIRRLVLGQWIIFGEIIATILEVAETLQTLELYETVVDGHGFKWVNVLQRGLRKLEKFEFSNVSVHSPQGNVAAGEARDAPCARRLNEWKLWLEQNPVQSRPQEDVRELQRYIIREFE
jgi:hypothetical protein